MPWHVIRKIASFLMAVLLSTVLSPSFGWEASASPAAHGHDVLLLDDHDGHAAQHHGDEDSHHHHGCAGHLLGHLQAQLSDPFVFATLDPAGRLRPEPASDFSSLFPERLDRPPLAPLPA
jgi:hypothetical protein